MRFRKADTLRNEFVIGVKGVDNKFVPEGIRFPVRFRAVLGVENRLHRTSPIAKVDEDHSPVIPAPVNPPDQLHLLADIRLGDFGAVVRPLKAVKWVQRVHDVIVRERPSCPGGIRPPLCRGLKKIKDE